MSSTADRSANAYVVSKREGWSNLVEIVRATLPKNLAQAARVLSKASGVGAASTLRAMQAINYGMAMGLTNDQIIEAGQEKIVGAFIKEKKARREEPLVKLSFLISPDLKEQVVEEFYRVGTILGTPRQEDFLTWLVAEMSSWTEAEILHSAGGEKWPSRKQKKDSKQPDMSSTTTPDAVDAGKK